MPSKSFLCNEIQFATWGKYQSQVLQCRSKGLQLDLWMALECRENAFPIDSCNILNAAQIQFSQLLPKKKKIEGKDAAKSKTQIKVSFSLFGVANLNIC